MAEGGRLESDYPALRDRGFESSLLRSRKLSAESSQQTAEEGEPDFCYLLTVFCFLSLEGCESGLIGTPGERMYPCGYRGFESHPFRI